MNILKKIFCKHDYEYVRKVEKYANLSGDMIYKRCKKCGKLTKGQFMTNEEQRYMLNKTVGNMSIEKIKKIKIFFMK